MPWSLGRHLRGLLVKFHKCFDAEAAGFPNIAVALQALEATVNEALPPWKLSTPRAAGGRPRKDPLRSRQNALTYARARVRKFQAKLRALETGKRRARGQPLTPLFLARVSLASPTTSARGFQKSWSDLIGTDSLGVSRKKVEQIRDSFASVVKERMAEQLAAFASRAAKSARIGAATRAPLL